MPRERANEVARSGVDQARERDRRRRWIAGQGPTDPLILVRRQLLEQAHRCPRVARTSGPDRRMWITREALQLFVAQLRTSRDHATHAMILVAHERSDLFAAE